MRTALSWTLATAIAVSAVALWRDEKPAAVMAAVERAAAGGDLPSMRQHPVRPERLRELPVTVTDLEVEPTRRDIFAVVQPPAPIQAATSAAAPPVPQPLAPAPSPPPPQPTWRYLGRMTAPSGDRLVMLARGDARLAVTKSTQLNDGFVVEDVGDDAIQLNHPTPGTTARIAVPLAAPPSS